MGNHTVGVLALKEMLRTEEVVAVFAHPDNPEDGKVYESVKGFALTKRISVYQPRRVREPEWANVVRTLCPELIVIADFNQLIPKNIIEIPPLGCLNMHPSLLPKYRGRAPVNWAIINGETETGLTIHFIDEGMDTGDILIQERIEIKETDTIKTIHEKMFEAYPKLLRQSLRLIKLGNPPRLKQDHSQAIVFKRRNPEDGLIDWTHSAIRIHNFVRAVTRPYPGAFTFWRGKKFLIWTSYVLQDVPTVLAKPSNQPGKVLGIVAGRGVAISTGGGVLVATELQVEGAEPVIAPPSDSLDCPQAGETFQGSGN